MAMMRRRIRVAAVGAFLAITHFCVAADISGTWIATIATPGEPQFARVSLKVADQRVSGLWGTSTIDGTINGDQLAIALTSDKGAPAGSLTANITGETLTGSGTLIPAVRPDRPAIGFSGGMGTARAGGRVSFTMARTMPPPASPRDLHFVPANFYATYSAANKPALTIFPGDVVHTWTADAGGVDANGVRHRGGDSNIGPFYVEDALPGDTLVVHLLKVRTNRSTAHQATRMNPHAVTASYLVGAQYDAGVTGDWTILPEKGIAVPSHPSEHMKNYSVPLKPMLGCVSVAPAGDEQFRGGDLGPFGGNMDYNDNVEGTTLYFPVFHPGALLGMGDGHAAMGDGEVTGSALETSMDVDFSVDIIPADSSGQVRAETADYLIAFGITGSVPESIQVATSQLATWIKQKYKLSDSEVAVLFASTLKYDITELVDSKYDVVAKVPKSVLSTMK
jgi:amidase